MTTSLRVRFDGKVLVPQEPVDLPVGQDLEVEIVPRRGAGEAEQSSLQWIAEHAVDDPSLPTDGARNLHHYLYGVPKQEEE